MHLGDVFFYALGLIYGARWLGALWLRSLSHYAWRDGGVKWIKIPASEKQYQRAGSLNCSLRLKCLHQSWILLCISGLLKWKYKWEGLILQPLVAFTLCWVQSKCCDVRPYESISWRKKRGYSPETRCDYSSTVFKNIEMCHKYQDFHTFLIPLQFAIWDRLFSL